MSMDAGKEKTLEEIYREGGKEGKGDKKVKWVVGVVVLLVVAGGVVMGVSKGWLGWDKGEIRERKGTGEVKGGEEIGGVDTVAWYAVHLTDGKVYYGHLDKMESDYPELTEVFYPEPDLDKLGRYGAGTAGEGSATSTEVDRSDRSDRTDMTDIDASVGAGKIVLVKLGTEAQRPEDRMVINKQNLLFYEKLAQDSPIVKAIRGYLGE